MNLYSVELFKYSCITYLLGSLATSKLPTGPSGLILSVGNKFAVTSPRASMAHLENNIYMDIVEKTKYIGCVTSHYAYIED